MGVLLIVEGEVLEKRQGSDNTGKPYFSAKVGYFDREMKTAGEEAVYFDKIEEFNAFPVEGAKVRCTFSTRKAKGVPGAVQKAKLIRTEGAVPSLGAAGEIPTARTAR